MRNKQALGSLLCVVVAGSAGGCGGRCVEPPAHSVIQHELWEAVPMEMDPFAQADGQTIMPCDASNTEIEDIDGRHSWTLETGTCNWATVQQRLPAALQPGDELSMEVFWFSQTSFLGGVAHVGLALDDDVVFTTDVPIPSEGDLLNAVVPIEAAYPAGTNICFHIGNHGSNTWNLLDIRKRAAPVCEGQPQ